MVRTGTTHDAGGIDRRGVLKAVGGTAVAAALAGCSSLIGADNIQTVAGVNPGYTFGEDEMAVFTQAIQRLTDAEVVYEGFPELGASDMSNHITSVNDEEPDVTFTSLWGGDVTTFLRQASANDMFDNTTVVGSILPPDRTPTTSTRRSRSRTAWHSSTERAIR